MNLAAISRAPDESVAARLLKCTVPTKTQSYRTKVELCVINVGLTTHFTSAERPTISIRETDEFSTLYICVRNRPVDEFWDSCAEGFVTSP